MAYAMQPITQQKLNRYINRIATLNSVSSVTTNFSVAPVPQQKIIERFQWAADLLKQINIFPVNNASGQKIGLDVGSTVASTKTASRSNPRTPVEVGNLEEIDTYLCTQTDYDVAYKYPLMDAWAHFPDFAIKLADMVVKAIALDKIRIGWNGTSRSANSDRVANPNLEDVNIGWLQKIRNFAPERNYPGEADPTTHVVASYVGSTRTYKNLDGLVQGAVESLIAEQWRDSPDLIAICGRNLLTDKYMPLLNSDQDPMNQIAARTLYSKRVLGTIPAVVYPFFPANTILITSLSNLSIYIHNGTMRRRIQDEPQYDQLSDYQSINECFVVENYEKCCLIENIHIDD